jgi:hypothetical protein
MVVLPRLLLGSYAHPEMDKFSKEPIDSWRPLVDPILIKSNTQPNQSALAGTGACDQRQAESLEGTWGRVDTLYSAGVLIYGVHSKVGWVRSR